MVELKLPWGKRVSDGLLVSAEKVESGLACGCVCAACGRTLIAAKGEVYRHHFRHHADDAECWRGGETALHLFAKQVICNSLALQYPVEHRGYQDRDFPVELGLLHAAASEVDLFDTGIRADVWAEYDVEPIAVEVFVAHRVDSAKVRRLVHYEIPCVEIDLSYYRHAEKSDEQWQQIVLRDAPRYWVFPPRHVREAELKFQREWIDEQKRKEDMARAVQLHLEEARLAEQQILEELVEQKRATLEQARRLADARARESAAQAKAIDEMRKVKAAELRLQFAGMSAALKQQRERERAVPNLQSLVQAHGRYDQIPDAAWADYRQAVAHWTDQRLGRGSGPLSIDAADDPAEAAVWATRDPCFVCTRPARFGYRQGDGMRWFCTDHRLANWWADARQ